MENLYFGCERGYIEQIRRVAQRNMLIHVYCSDNFAFFNLVDFYYRAINENAILMFLLLIALYPVLFMCIAFIADKYMSVGMQDLSNRFNLSPTLAAVTLIAFANGAPDVLSSLSASGKIGGELISLGSLYGGYIFSSTLVITNVIWNAPDDIKLPKYAVLKELGFYLVSVFIIIGFALRKRTGYLFIGVYLTLYIVYIIVTLLLEKYSPKPAESEENQPLEGDGRVGDETNPEQPKVDEEEIKIKENSVVEPQDGAVVEGEKQEEEEEKEDGFFTMVLKEAYEDDSGIIENIVIPPLAMAGLFTVSYLNNPLMKTHSKYVIVGISLIWTIRTLELADLSLLTYGIIGLAAGLVCLILDLLKVSDNLLAIIFELISVFAAIGWIKIFSGIIIDFIGFLAFYFNINEVILSSILLSAGNTIGDFFGNAALAKGGASIMGAMASYSGQIFNNFIGFSINILGGLGTSDEFDIFALNRNKDARPGNEKPMPITSIFIMFVIISVLSVLSLGLVYLFTNDFTLKKSYTVLLLIFYGGFFGISLMFGYFSSTA